MSIVGKYKKISASQKKCIVLYFIIDVIMNSDMDNIDKNNLQFIMKNIVPNVIDMLVDVVKKKIYYKICQNLVRQINIISSQCE